MSDTDTNIFFYNPSLPAAIVLTVMYGLLATWHFYSCIIKPHNLPEKHRYTIPLFVAAAISTVGFAVRAAATNDVSNIGLYAPQASLIIISPIFVCASLYLLLANLVRRCLPDVGAQKLFGIGPHWLGRIFIASDIVAFLTQCSGSGIAASSNWEGSTKDIGVYILIAGLAIQLATFSLFLLLLWKFFFKVNTMFGWFSPNSKTVVVEMWIAGACVEVSLNLEESLSYYRTIPPPIKCLFGAISLV